MLDMLVSFTYNTTVMDKRGIRLKGCNMKAKLYSACLVLLGVLTVFFLFSQNPVHAAPQDSIQKAKQFYDDMDYDASITELNRFINANKTNEAKYPELSKAYYLLAKIYFEVGEDFKIVDKHLHQVFTYSHNFKTDEVNPDFKARTQMVKKLVDMQRKTAAASASKAVPGLEKKPPTTTPTPAKPEADPPKTKSTINVPEKQESPKKEPITSESLKSQPQAKENEKDNANNIFSISNVDVPPVLKSKPHLVLSRRIRGKYRNERIHFVVELLIDEKGKVKEVREVSGLDKFIEKEMKAYLKKWRFIAASKDGRKVKTWKPTTIEFHVTTETRKQFRKN